MVTPLARKIMDSLFVNKDWGVLNIFQQSHFFDVTEIAGMCLDFSREIHKTGLSKDNLFLPAPWTWLEFKPYPLDKDLVLRAFRVGFLIQEDRNNFYVTWNNNHQKSGDFMIKKEEFKSLKGSEYREKLLKEAQDTEDKRKVLEDARLILFMLTMINQPRLIGRRQHMPDSKLERKLLKARPNIGKFPLQAWTEITLSVSAPTKDVSGNASTEAHLTGTKPLHFCRQHWRVRLGRLERVKAHWRGDPSLGVKRSRYIVTP